MDILASEHEWVSGKKIYHGQAVPGLLTLVVSRRFMTVLRNQNIPVNCIFNIYLDIHNKRGSAIGVNDQRQREMVFACCQK
jgi:hypothetical protein